MKPNSETENEHWPDLDCEDPCVEVHTAQTSTQHPANWTACAGGVWVLVQQVQRAGGVGVSVQHVLVSVAQAQVLPGKPFQYHHQKLL